MAVTIKQLIDKNKKAFDDKHFIESINLSYILVNKALKQIVKDEFKQENKCNDEYEDKYKKIISR